MDRTRITAAIVATVVLAVCIVIVLVARREPDVTGTCYEGTLAELYEKVRAFDLFHR